MRFKLRNAVSVVFIGIILQFVCVTSQASSQTQWLPDERNSIAVFQKNAIKVVYVHRLKTVPASKRSGKITQVSAGTGSGIIWDHDGHIVTNYHVIRGAEALSITLAGVTVSAKVVGAEPRKDLAVLQVSTPRALEKIQHIEPFILVKSNELVVGQKALAIGNPYGLENSLSVGVISALKRQVPGVGGVSIWDMIQTDAAINPGNSGGPLLDSQGRLVGLNTAIFSNSGSSGGIGFAVPADDLQNIVPQIIHNGHSVLAGIGIQRALPEEASKRGVKKGVLIAKVLPNTPAALAGLQGTFRDHWGRVHLGDVVTSVNGHSIRGYDDFYHQFLRVKVGQPISMTLDRNGRLMDYQMKTIDIAAYTLNNLRRKSTK